MDENDALSWIGDYSSPYVSDVAELLRDAIARAEAAEAQVARMTTCEEKEARWANGKTCRERYPNGESSLCQHCSNAAELEAEAAEATNVRLRELINEAIGEVKAYREVGSNDGHPFWCSYCHKYGEHTPDCLITLLAAELEEKDR